MIDLSLLPIEEFPGRVIVVDTERDTEKAISYLSTFKEVGFDTETRPNFRKGQSNKISLMQISTEDTCFLFRLNHIGIPEALEHFLSDASIQKIGLSLRDDFNAIQKQSFSIKKYQRVNVSVIGKLIFCLKGKRSTLHWTPGPALKFTNN